MGYVFVSLTKKDTTNRYQRCCEYKRKSTRTEHQPVYGSYLGHNLGINQMR
jgi:hypothetical protein